ncbi:MAG: hypothetical protein IKY98_02090 [Alphaproteobacteria bacterium]|nr:hypothetical protein [Alphaproteobacteria bacterium]
MENQVECGQKKSEIVRKKFLLDSLEYLSKEAKNPIDVQNHFLIRRSSMMADSVKILVLRALIYNTHLKKAFLGQDENLMCVVNDLIFQNDKLNQQMDRPIAAQIRSCSGDTLMHCAARMGYRRLLVALYNAGADASLNTTNSHGYTPYDSVINQIERVKSNPDLTNAEKGRDILDLTNVKDTISNLNHRHILMTLDLVQEELDIAKGGQEELANIMSALPQRLASDGLMGGLFRTLLKAGGMVVKKKKKQAKVSFITEANAEQANLEEEQNKNFVIFYGAPSPSVISYMTRGIDRTRQ